MIKLRIASSVSTIGSSTKENAFKEMYTIYSIDCFVSTRTKPIPIKRKKEFLSGK